MRHLGGKKASGFFLWCYLAGNSEGFILALSHTAVEAATGMKRDAYDQGVRLLLDEGFLVQAKGQLYNFYEFPESHESNFGETPSLTSGKPQSQLQGNPNSNFRETPQDNTIPDTTSYTTGDTINQAVSKNRVFDTNCKFDEDDLDELEIDLALIEFVYDGNGKGGQRAWLGSLLGRGYYPADILNACSSAVVNNADEKVAYVMKSLDYMTM